MKPSGGPLPKTQVVHINLDSPLGVKLFVPEGFNGTYCTTKLSQRRHQEKPYFDLWDPHCRQLDNQYNSLQDPYLKEFYKNKARIRSVTKHGLLTPEKEVVCSLKEFNEYCNYLKRNKMDREMSYRQQQKELVKEFLILQEQKIIPEDVPVRDMREWLLEQGCNSFWQQGEARRLRCQQGQPKADWPLSSAEQACKVNQRQMLQELEVEARRELRLERRWKKPSVKPGLLKALREAYRMRGKTKIVPTAAEDGQSAMSDRQPTPPVQLSDRVKTVVQEQRRPRVTVEKLLGTIAETVVSRAVQTVKTAVLPTMLGREQGSEGECLPLTSPESLSSGSLTPHSSGRFNELYPCSFSSQSSSWDPDQLSPTVLDNRVGGESSPLPGQQGKSVDRQEAVLRDCAADIVSLVQQEAELETNRHSSTALAIRLEEGEAARTENSSRLGSLCLTDLEQRLVDPICGIVARADDTLPPPPVPSDPRDSAQIPPCHKASSEAILSMADSPGGQVDSLGHEAERTQTPHSSAAAGRASPPRDNISTEVRQQPRQPSASSSTSYSSSSSGASSVASALTEDMIAGLLYRLSPEPHSPLTALAVDLVDSVLQEVSEDWELSTALEQQCAGKEGLRSHPDSVRAAVSSAPQQLVRNSEDLSSTITSSVMEQLNQAFLGLDRSQSVTSLPPCSPSFEPAEAQELSDTQEDEEQLPASLAMTPTAQANIELRDRMCDEGSSLGEEEQVTKLATLNGLLVRASMDALIPTSVAPVEEHLAADSPGGQVDSLGHEAERTQTPHSSAAAGRASPPRDNISTEVRQQPWQPSASSSTSYSSSSSGASSVASALTEDMIAGLLYRLSPEPHSPLTALAVDLVDSVLQEVSEDWELSTALEQQCAGKEGLRSHPDSVRAAVSSAPQQLVQHSGSPAALRSALSSGSEDLRSAITSSVVEQLNQAFLGLDRSQRVTSPVARELQSRSRVSPPVELEMPSTSLPLCSPSFEPAKAQELSDTQEDEEQLPASLAMTPTADLPTQPGAAGQARGEEPEDLPAGAAEAPRKDKPSKKEHIRHFLCRVSRSFSQLRNVRVSPEPSRPKSI